LYEYSRIGIKVKKVKQLVAGKKSNRIRNMLPMHATLIILKAAEDRHVLVSLARVNGLVEASIVHNSKYLFSNAEWRSDGIEGLPEDYTFRRISSRSAEAKIYSSTLCKTNNYLIIPWHEAIHIYTMKYPGVILPSTYFRVFKNEDTANKWHFKKPLSPEREPPSTVPTVPAKIPSHIVRGFIESAIQKKEVCPITLDALVMGNVAMTSCGHLFEKQAVVSYLTTFKICPTCRAAVEPHELVIL